MATAIFIGKYLSMLLYRFLSLFLVGLILPLTACTKSSSAEFSIQPNCQSRNAIERLACNLARAQQAKNFSETERLTKEITELIGSQAGVPETPTQFYSVDRRSRDLTVENIRSAFNPYIRRIERDAWWLSRPDPTELNVPLRNLASIVTGTLAAKRAGAEYPERLLQIAESAGDYLLWAQEQGGNGLFPFPAAQGKQGRPFEVAERYLSRVEQEGRLSEVVVNGWIVKDLFGEGGLQFDNGLCGVAMLELYEATGQKKYLKSALKAADWAISQPVVSNWNYNSFSIFLLAHAYRITGNESYLESAKEKARLGLYPGQIQTGSNRGRWVDPHNANLVYHYIIIRGLGALVAVLPENDPDLPKALDILSLALRVRNAEIIEKGAASPDTTLEVLARLQLSLPASSSSLPDEGRTEAIKQVGHYATSMLLRGKISVSPGAWGLYLELLNQ